MRANNKFTNLVHDQDTRRERERNTPEHAWNRGGKENVLKALSVQVHNGDTGGEDHADGYHEVLTRTPEGVGLEDGDATVADGEKITVLREDNGDVAKIRV